MLSTRLFREFFSSEKSGGLILVLVTIVSLILANSAVGKPLILFIHHEYFGLSVAHWVNDGLMFLFFLMIGLELEREIYEGELSSWRNASLPVFAAIGGMIVPAAIHFSMNAGTLMQRGAGIPMATDIAFSLGVLSLFGSKVPYSLKVFLTALAIADDLGAIVVIAIFYTKGITISYLSSALAIFALLLVLNRIRVTNLWPYLIGGAAMWWCLLNSGVHATIGGVLLAFAIPFSKETHDCVSHRLQHRLHFPVALGILPIFALVNTCIPLGGEWYLELMQRNTIGIFLGLVIGKPLGILAFCGLAVALKIGQLPNELRWSHLIGAGLLAGIGFTMSIFVSLLAFEDQAVVNLSQITVLIASTTSAVLGMIWFMFFISRSSSSANFDSPQRTPPMSST